MNLILEPNQFRRLDGLRLNPRKSFGGRVRGERLTRKKGISIEFADYREYSEGDDLRHLDWNVLARLDTPVMRTYQDEEDLAVYLLVDFSPSMDFGEPSKRQFGAALAATFGYVALMSGDSVIPIPIGYREPKSRTYRNRSNYPNIARWLTQPREGEGVADPLSRSLRAFAGSASRAGLVVLISDGMDPDATSAMRALAGRGHEVLFLQTLSDVELDPDLEGDLCLIDAEGRPAVEITANRTVLREYRDRLARHNQEISDAVLRGGGRHRVISTSIRWDDVLDSLRRDGWLTTGGAS